MPYANFGTLITEVDVDIAVVKTLRLWFPTYLRQAESERGMAVNTLARPRAESYVNALEDDEFFDHALPAIIVTTAETDEVMPTQNGYAADWRVAVSAVTRGRTPAESRAVGALFGACVRRTLVQQADLDGAARATRWTRGAVVPLDGAQDEGRYVTVALNEFLVSMDDVLDTDGPLLPDPYYPDPDPAGQPDEPYDPLASVAAVTISVTDRS